MRNVLSVLTSLSVFPACASVPTQADQMRAAASEVVAQQYFKGSIQRSSLDGQTPYGPSFSSLVHRTIAPAGDKVVECVLQEGKVFITVMTRTAAPLIFTAVDTAGLFNGKLNYEDESLLAWSYDIQVVTPQPGKILGSLSDGNGARIDSQTDEMTITKIWNNQVRIHEEYKSISRDEFLKKFDEVTHGQATADVTQACRN